MGQENRDSIVFCVINQLRNHGSWCGETHIQKAFYFLKEFFGQKIDYDFYLYLHGPFSSNLRSHLNELVASGKVVLSQKYPYGPSATLGASVDHSSFSELSSSYPDRISFIAEKFGSSGVAFLERISTALYVRQTFTGLNDDEKIEKLVELKPHISEKEASEAFLYLRDMESEARKKA